MGRRNGGISKESMTKLGTPIGAGPKVATVRLGLVFAGEPSGLRRVGCSIFCFSPLAICLAPWPFLFCLPNRPGVLPPAVFLPALPPPVLGVLPLEPLPPLEPPPVIPLTMSPAPPKVVVPPPPELPPEVGALYSEVSSALLHPGSPRSTSPSPSSSERFEHCGRTWVLGTLTWAFPTLTVPEIAVPAATIAKDAPSAMITRSFLVIWPTVPAREIPWVCRSRPPRTRRHGGRYCLAQFFATGNRPL